MKSEIYVSNITSRCVGGTSVTLALVLTILGVTPAAEAGKLQTWVQESSAAFRVGQLERLNVSDRGVVRLARKSTTFRELGASRVWDLLRESNGTLLAATGDEGLILRRREGLDRWEPFFKVESSQALSLAELPNGQIAIGTGPNGSVVLLSSGGEELRNDRLGQASYVWDLGVTADGTLYAATGPTGELWSRSLGGSWELVFKSPHGQLLALAVSANDSVITGGQGGLLYEVKPGGSARVLYDAPEPEIRSILIGPDGSIFGATASEPLEGGRTRDSASDDLGAHEPLDAELALELMIPRGTAVDSDPTTGSNAIYRYSTADGLTEVFRKKVVIFDLGWWNNRLVAATGPEAELFEISGTEASVRPTVRAGAGQFLATATDREGRLILGTGAPASIVTVDPSYVESGTLRSEVFDTRLQSRFGAIEWDARLPEGTEVSIQLRTGNVGIPDGTWSDWTPPNADPPAIGTLVPPGRFVQYQATLATRDPSTSPRLKGIRVHYQSVNLAPEIKSIKVPASEATNDSDSSDERVIELEWEAIDPNDDELSFTLEIRKEGWPNWIRVDNDPIQTRSFDWDASTVPEGRYRLRLTADDRRSNLEGTSFQRSLISEPFLVDHQGPEIMIVRSECGADVDVSDLFSRIERVSYAIDGGEWTAVFPQDGLFDTRSEHLSVSLDHLEAGAHLLVVRGTDALGNVGTGDLVFEIPDAP